MNKNEKAAVAVGLWEPGRKCEGAEHCDMWRTEPFKTGRMHTSDGHDIPAPDMRLPENLWRALERMQNRGWIINFGTDPKDCSIHVAYADVNKGFQFYRKPDLFAALVALYDAEHKDQS